MIEFYTCSMTLRIKMLRVSLGLTQQQLADKAGLSRSQLSEIESETKPANTLRLNAIAAALGVNVDALFDQKAESIYKSELLQLMEGMNDADRATLVRMARAMVKPD